MNANSLLKCIVWDLDDTVWNGTLRNGEDVAPNEVALQTIRLADAAGVLQSIASRNDYESAMQKLRELDIDHYFLYPQIDASISKVSAIRGVAQHLNIGTDSVAFVDDNPFELYEVSRYLPEICVYPAEDMLSLREYIVDGWTDGVTRNRRELMLIRERRLRAERAFAGSREEFLRECAMVLAVRKALAADLGRAEELAARANRLHNTRERPDMEALAAYISDSDKLMYVCELEDIFGNHGIVGICLICVSERLHIDLFCVSCRVEGRGIGAAFLSEAINGAMRVKSGLQQILCVCKTYDKDKSAYLLLKLMGFSIAWKEPDRIMMQMDLPCVNTAPSWIRIKKEKY